MRTLFLCLLAVLPLSSNAADCDGPYTSGWEPWEPYQYQQGDQITGLDIDLVRAVVTNMGCEIAFKEMRWTRLLSEVEKGNVHFAVSASKTPERAEYAHFSLPYRTESVVLYVVKGTAPKFKFKSLPELKKAKFRLGAARNNYYGDEFDELMKQPEFKQKVDIVKSDEINFRKLMRGRIDGFLVDPVAGAELRKKYRYLGEVEIHPAHIYSSDIFVMLSRKSVNEEYVDAFNSSLIELKTSGRHKAILDKYLN